MTYDQNTIHEKNQHFQKAFGYSFSYYDIDNKDARIEGSLVSFNSRYSFKYYALPSRKGIYLGGAFRITIGTETIQYGRDSETKIFFGPTLEEFIGISLDEKVFIEAGFFQIKLIASDLLPHDLGFDISLNFRI